MDTKKIVSIYDKQGQIYNKKIVTLQEENNRIKLKYEKKKSSPLLFIDGEQYVKKSRWYFKTV